MVDHVVDVHDITVTIKGRTILSNLSIQVEEGTFHGIIGPNGAGKTTLFNAIQGFRKPAQGSIEPLPDNTPSHEVQPDWQALIAEAGDDVAALRAMWTDAQARGASEAILNDIKNAATAAHSKED